MMSPGMERARVLITVKTYPNPSEMHGEIVCVAGVRLDLAVPSWIRLYPMRFRNTEAYLRFKKYDIIEVDVRKRDGRDPRVESYQPDQQTLTVVGHVKSDGRQWAKRRELMAPLIGATSACRLIRSNPTGQMHKPAPSLGLIKPRIDSVVIRSGTPWSSKQLAKVEAASTPTLFGDEIAMLEPMPFRLTYQYHCTDADCRGHQQQCLDWELGQAGRAWLRDYGPTETQKRIRDKWEAELCDPARDLYFYIGNQAMRRRSFEVLGIWYPRLPVNADPDQLMLL